MKIIILGAGAIGSLFGAKLSKSNNVILIGRKQHVDKINKNGLKITGLENKKYKLTAKTKINKIEKNTLILLTTKVYDNKKAINKIKNLVKKDTIIQCIQNGLGLINNNNNPTLAQMFDKNDEFTTNTYSIEIIEKEDLYIQNRYALLHALDFLEKIHIISIIWNNNNLIYRN